MTIHTNQAETAERTATSAAFGRRRMGGALIAVTVLAFLFLLSIAVGSKDIPFGVVVDSLPPDRQTGMRMSSGTCASAARLSGFSSGSPWG